MRSSFLPPAKSQANLATPGHRLERDGYLCQLRYRGCTVEASIADLIENIPNRGVTRAQAT